MREIKFRAKSASIPDWLYGYLCDEKYMNDVRIGEKLKYVPETVGQYTGLKDKNGKEIYEGIFCKATMIKSDKYSGLKSIVHL